MLSLFLGTKTHVFVFKRLIIFFNDEINDSSDFEKVTDVKISSLLHIIKITN